MLRPKALPANEIAKRRQHEAHAERSRSMSQKSSPVTASRNTGVAGAGALGPRVRRSSNVLAKLTEVEGSLRDADRGRQVKFHGVAAGHDRA